MKRLLLKIASNVRNNVILADFWDTLFSKSIVRRQVLSIYINRMKKIDSIRDFESFKNTIGLLLKHNYAQYTYGGRYEQLRFYGYYFELLNYSGYKKRIYPILTAVEHGVRFGNSKWKYNDYNTCYICQGKNRMSEINDQDEKVPVIALGPYINYSSQYYDDKKINEIKKQNGKTLLVFLGHTTEWEPDKQENDFVKLVYDKYGSEFDTVMVCVYWRDVFCEEIDRFKEKGAQIVSAGFRQDPNFIRRLKTIISLSDFVISNDIGTNIGYALCLGKTFVLEEVCKDYSNDIVLKNNYMLFRKAFSLDLRKNFSDEQIQLQKELYEDFWAPSEIKTNEEMYLLFSAFDKLLKFSFYNPYRLRYIFKENKTHDILNPNDINELKEIFGLKFI